MQKGLGKILRVVTFPTFCPRQGKRNYFGGGKTCAADDKGGIQLQAVHTKIRVLKKLHKAVQVAFDADVWEVGHRPQVRESSIRIMQHRFKPLHS